MKKYTLIDGLIREVKTTQSNSISSVVTWALNERQGASTIRLNRELFDTPDEATDYFENGVRKPQAERKSGFDTFTALLFGSICESLCVDPKDLKPFEGHPDYPILKQQAGRVLRGKSITQSQYEKQFCVPVWEQFLKANEAQKVQNAVILDEIKELLNSELLCYDPYTKAAIESLRHGARVSNVLANALSELANTRRENYLLKLEALRSNPPKIVFYGSTPKG